MADMRPVPPSIGTPSLNVPGVCVCAWARAEYYESTKAALQQLHKEKERRAQRTPSLHASKRRSQDIKKVANLETQARDQDANMETQAGDLATQVEDVKQLLVLVDDAMDQVASKVDKGSK